MKIDKYTIHGKIKCKLVKYRGYKVEHDDINEGLCFISTRSYSKAISLMYDLVAAGYMIQGFEDLKEENIYVIAFNKEYIPRYIKKNNRTIFIRKRGKHHGSTQFV